MKQFQSDGKGNINSDTLKPRCHFHKKTLNFLKSLTKKKKKKKNKILFFLICTCVQMGCCFSDFGTSWRPYPSAGEIPSWAFLLTEREPYLGLLWRLSLLPVEQKQMYYNIRAFRFLKEDTKLWIVFNKRLSVAPKVYSNSLVYTSSQWFFSPDILTEKVML